MLSKWFFIHRYRVPQCYTWAMASVVYWFIHAYIWHVSNKFKLNAGLSRVSKDHKGHFNQHRGPDRYIRVFHLRFRINHYSRNTRLQQHGIRARWPYFGAVLTPLHRRERVRWCNILRGWTFRNWRRIWFRDESRFLLQKRDGRLRVYKRRNERFSSSCVQEVDSYSGCSVMMWAAISNDSKAELVHLQGNLTAVR